MFQGWFDTTIFFFDTSIFWAMRCNDFALANAVLRAVPDGHSRKSFHRRAILNGATVSAIRLLSLSHGKIFLPFFLHKQQMFINFAEAKQ